MKKLSILIAASLIGCSTVTPPPARQDTSVQPLLRAYVTGFLQRNPVVNTYLGGSGLDPSLRLVDGTLRDYSPEGIRAEDRWLSEMMGRIEAIDPGTITASDRIDRDVALAQIAFLLRQHQVRKYQQRSLDSFTDEPFRGVDWQLQGMTQTGATTYGTMEEWKLVASRLEAVPRFLESARGQLRQGILDSNTPDHRMLKRNGINTTTADAEYFGKTLPALASERITGPERDALLLRINAGAKNAAAAYTGLHDFIATTFFDDVTATDSARGVKRQFGGDRFQFGEKEYDWALRNNLRVSKNAAQLYEEAWPVVEKTRSEMIALARSIGATRGWPLPADGNAAVRRVFDELSKDYPKTDAEMVRWYSEAAFRLVEFARRTGVFDVPADYKLEVVETPAPLRASIDGAAYYPAPPFKNSGVGRYYVTPTGNDEAALKSNNRASLADLSAHEGFPGHDWHYKVMTQARDQISPVRWLTPGAVEDSSSMWEDSMAAEGWALYSEALMAEPQPGAPQGFYTPEERLYQLQGQLYRDLRVRVDIGIHTGRMSFTDAVDLFSQVVDFLPGQCSQPESLKNDDAKRASCTSAQGAIFRYSKWPTQAITYRLGKDEILGLRREAASRLGDRFSPKQFHLRFMQQGTIPAGYFHDELLRQLEAQPSK